MTLYLLRHAKAGSRSSWDGEDRLRPLSGTGRRQAARIAESLAGLPFARVLSSPYTRCTETVAPVAGSRGLAVEETDALAEGALLPDVLALVGAVSAGGAVLCSHGDVIPMLLDHFASTGLELGPEPACKKGSIWVIDTDVPEHPMARYLEPPLS